MSFLDFIPNLFSSDKGAGYQANEADLNPIISQDQVNDRYNQQQGGLNQQQAFVNALMNQNGLGNQQAVLSQQQGLANQLQMQANGGGPNPALAMLNQQTGNNIAQQNALLGSQRGVNGNVGLLGRQAAMQGAGIQQNAVGQAAVMQAQQQLAAQGLLSNQQNNMAGVAGQQVGQQQGGLNALNQLQQNAYGQAADAASNFNNSRISGRSNVNNANAQIAQQNAQTQGKAVGGALNGLTGGKMAFAHGGVIPPAPPGNIPGLLPGWDGPKKSSGGGMPEVPGDTSVLEQYLGGMGGGMGANGGAEVGAQAATMPILLPAFGGQIPGRAQVKGDSYQNDQVPAMLSPGEIVLPKSVSQSEDPALAAQKFVAALMAKRQMGKKK